MPMSGLDESCICRIWQNKNGNQDCSCRSTIGVKTAWNSQRLCWMVLVFNQTQYCWMFSWFREKKHLSVQLPFVHQRFFSFFLEYLCMLLSVCFEQASEGKDYKSLLWLYFSLCIFHLSGYFEMKAWGTWGNFSVEFHLFDCKLYCWMSMVWCKRMGSMGLYS